MMLTAVGKGMGDVNLSLAPLVTCWGLWVLVSTPLTPLAARKGGAPPRLPFQLLSSCSQRCPRARPPSFQKKKLKKQKNHSRTGPSFPAQEIKGQGVPRRQRGTTSDSSPPGKCLLSLSGVPTAPQSPPKPATHPPHFRC